MDLAREPQTNRRKENSQEKKLMGNQSLSPCSVGVPQAKYPNFIAKLCFEFRTCLQSNAFLVVIKLKCVPIHSPT